MPLDQSFVGRVYAPTPTYEVCREKIREFAAALGDPDPAYRAPAGAEALGYPDVIAPPTFAIVLTSAAVEHVIADPELGLDYSRVVHGEQRFVHARPLHAGDRVRVVVAVESIRSVAGNDMLSTRSEVSTEQGELVCTAYSVLVSRGTGA